jgi:hypothetical protein
MVKVKGIADGSGVSVTECGSNSIALGSGFTRSEMLTLLGNQLGKLNGGRGCVIDNGLIESLEQRFKLWRLDFDLRFVGDDIMGGGGDGILCDGDSASMGVINERWFRGRLQWFLEVGMGLRDAVLGDNGGVGLDTAHCSRAHKLLSDIGRYLGYDFSGSVVGVVGVSSVGGDISGVHGNDATLTEFRDGAIASRFGKYVMRD